MSLPVSSPDCSVRSPGNQSASCRDTDNSKHVFYFKLNKRKAFVDERPKKTKNKKNLCIQAANFIYWLLAAFQSRARAHIGVDVLLEAISCQ